MPNSLKPELILVDGSSFLFRAYHALPPLTTQSGEPTGAMYGVLSMLKKLKDTYQATYFAVIFDSKHKTFRHELYPAYKANRPPIDEELALQIEPLHTIIRAMGFPLLIVDGVEADDVIGTFAQLASHASIPTVIATSDKDMAQLVNPHITLVNTMSDTFMDEAGVVAKFGVKPSQIIDYLTLIGDPVDNVPGVPKVGPKTAVKWLETYDNLENIISHASEFTGKVGDYLRESLEALPLSKKLVTIDCEVKDLPPLTTLMPQAPDNAALKTFFSRYEFKNWLKQLDSFTPNETQTETQLTSSKTNDTLILDSETLSTWIKRLEQSTCFSFDTETDNLDPILANLVGISVACSADEAAYIPVCHNYLGAPTQLGLEEVLEAFKPLLSHSGITKIGQNLKYDINVLKKYACHFENPLYDTMLESYVYDSTSSRHDMGSLAKKYLQLPTIAFEEVAGKGAHQLTFNEIEIDKALPYAAEDARITYQLHQTLYPKLEKNPALQQVFETIEMPLMPILAEIEYTGVLIDAKKLKKQSLELGEKIQALETEIFQLSDSQFNLNSPKQLQEILYNKLHLPILQKTPTGQPSTAEPVLQELAKDYPLPALILSYRSLSKLKSTYTDSLPEKINPITGRVHTSYHQAITATGRLSSSDPNLQNIPVRTEEGRAIRQAFIAPPHAKILAADYSQIELRIMAHLSQDLGLLNAFSKGIDIHKATASEIFGIAAEDVTSDQRRKAKAINFGLIYGMSAFGLAKQLDIDRQEAQDYMNLYFSRYPKVKTYMDNAREFVHKNGFVETLYGRRLYLPQIKSKNKQEVMAAERAAINAPMQGTAADLIKIAMVNTFRALQTKPSSTKMIMQVHDELVFEILEKDLESDTLVIREQMESAIKIDVPLVVDIGVGNNWDEAH
jgi:DNA polymerase I